MTELTYRTRIDDLASVGEELTEEHLRLVAGAADKKKSGGGRPNDGTCSSIGTYVYGPGDDGYCEQDSHDD
jgi:hypothetical protein